MRKKIFEAYDESRNNMKRGTVIIHPFILYIFSGTESEDLMAYLEITGAEKPSKPYPYMSNAEGTGAFDEDENCDLDVLLKGKMQPPLGHWSKFFSYV